MAEGRTERDLGPWGGSARWAHGQSMTRYESWWRAVVGLLMVLTVVVTGLGHSWWTVAGTAGVLAVLGAAMGASWAEEGRWRLAARWGAWSGAAGILLVGLPVVAGGPGAALVVVLAVTCPPLVRDAAGLLPGRARGALGPDLVRLSTRDLDRRWRRTSEQRRDRRTSVSVALQLVRERERILDEIERRDPEAFAEQLARTGWRSLGSVPE